MDELEAAFAVITETWFSTSIAMETDLIDLHGRAGLSVIAKNRPPNPQGVSHGGVALIYNESKCSFTEVDVQNPADWEVVVA